MTGPTLLTVTQLCRRWGVTQKTLRRWIHAGHIRVVFLGEPNSRRRLLRIATSEIERVESSAQPWRPPSN